MDLKAPMSFEEQLKQLVAHVIIVNDRNFALENQY